MSNEAEPSVRSRSPRQKVGEDGGGVGGKDGEGSEGLVGQYSYRRNQTGQQTSLWGIHLDEYDGDEPTQLRCFFVNGR